jgi:hypothetical protein
LPHHHSNAIAKFLRFAEIGTNARSQFLGLADVEDAIARITHDIHPRLLRQLLEASFQAFWVFDERQGFSRGRHEELKVEG